MKKSVGVITLGCDKNRVDTENMLYNLSCGGFDITNDYENAQVIIVNTCAFIQSARKEAIDVILAAAEYKKTAKCQKLIVTGCLPQKYPKVLACELPEVDKFLGTNDYGKICDVINELYCQESDTCIKQTDLNRIITTPVHFAYLKIADGCNNHCTFCTIPSIRGAYRSKSIEELKKEAQALAFEGVKELILVAQDVTRYGVDIYGKPALTALIKELSKTDICCLRLMYCYPELVTDELITEIVSNSKVAKYIDIPVQHISDGVLKRMNRRGDSSLIKELFKKLRRNGIAVRTTLMVGFPGETQEDFEELCSFVREYSPEHVGIFAYSKEEGTPSYKLKNQVAAKVKAQRVKTLGKIHLNNRKKLNKATVGKTLKVIYEDIDFDRNMFVGRTQYDAPEIDTKIYFTADYVDIGEYYNVKVTGYSGYDLLGEKL